VPSVSDAASDEIPLAPLDEEEERRSRAQRRQAQDYEARILEGGAQETPQPTEESAVPEGEGRRDPLKEMLLRYVRGMATGRLADCDEIVAALVGKRKVVAQAIDKIMADPPTGRVVDDLPPPIVLGYLKQMLGQL